MLLDRYMWYGEITSLTYWAVLGILEREARFTALRFSWGPKTFQKGRRYRADLLCYTKYFVQDQIRSQGHVLWLPPIQLGTISIYSVRQSLCYLLPENCLNLVSCRYTSEKFGRNECFLEAIRGQYTILFFRKASAYQARSKFRAIRIQDFSWTRSSD